MSDIRFIYFDLDDTLLDHRRAERRALADLHAAFPETFSGQTIETVQDTYHRHNLTVWRRYGQGDLTKEEAKLLRFEKLIEALSLDGLTPRLMSDTYLDCYTRHWAFVDGAQAAFHTLADRFPVGVLTNGFSEIQHAKLSRFPEIRDRLASLVISEEAGYMKPHPALFAHAAEAAATPPSAILYIGDSYHSDVQGALGAGWQIAWYTSDGQEHAEVFRFQDWAVLLRRLA